MLSMTTIHSVDSLTLASLVIGEGSRRVAGAGYGQRSTLGLRLWSDVVGPAAAVPFDHEGSGRRRGVLPARPRRHGAHPDRGPRAAHRTGAAHHRPRPRRPELPRGVAAPPLAGRLRGHRGP